MTVETKVGAYIIVSIGMAGLEQEEEPTPDVFE